MHWTVRYALLAIVVGVFILAFPGLAFSLYPCVIVDPLTVSEAANSAESLIVAGIGAAISVPAINFYTIFSYRISGGKVRELKYA
jgi:cytochrome d ubiquinol oxidase subunit II